jgi:uncharacterized protein DUF4293
MIQRIQSIYLFLAVLISILVFFVPFSEKVLTPESTYSRLVIDGTLSADNGDVLKEISYFLFSFNLLVTSVLVFIIFSYKKRLIQLKLCSFVLLLDALYLVLILYLTDHMGSGEINGLEPRYLIGSYVILIQALLVLLGQRAIRKDEKLIRSMDRIR